VITDPIIYLSAVAQSIVFLWLCNSNFTVASVLILIVFCMQVIFGPKREEKWREAGKAS